MGLISSSSVGLAAEVSGGGAGLEVAGEDGADEGVEDQLGAAVFLISGEVRVLISKCKCRD